MPVTTTPPTPNNFNLTRLSEMILPESISNQVQLIIQSSRRTQRLPGHIMLDGIAGGGKTTLANIIGNELGIEMIQCGISTDYTQLLVKLFNEYRPKKNVIPRRIYFIDEAHALPKAVYEMLLTVLENNTIALSKNGVNRNFDLPPSTWIIATTNPEQIGTPFKNRFRHHITFYPYDQPNMEQIATRNLKKFNLTLDQPSISMLAKISRQTPRTLNGIILNLIDYTSLINTTVITTTIFNDFMRYIGIDQYGLSERDRLVIRALGEGLNLNALPLRTLATNTGIDEQTLKETVEPYLVRTGVILITTRGRTLTQYGSELYKELS